MSQIVSRFLSFEETLGAGLVKFAYFVLLAVLAIGTVGAMIGGLVAAFTGDVAGGIGTFLLAPLRFVVALILLRVATEVVLAILSIDDQLTDGARTEGAMPRLGGGRSEASASSSSSASVPGGVGLTDDTEASKPSNQEAPFVRAGEDAAAGAKADAGSPAKTAPPAKSVKASPPAKKTTKKSTKKSTKSAASSSAAASSGTEAAGAVAASPDEPPEGATSAPSAKRTAEAAKAATRPSASSSDGGSD